MQSVDFHSIFFIFSTRYLETQSRLDTTNARAKKTKKENLSEPGEWCVSSQSVEFLRVMSRIVSRLSNFCANPVARRQQHPSNISNNNNNIKLVVPTKIPPRLRNRLPTHRSPNPPPPAIQNLVKKNRPPDRRINSKHESARPTIC